MQYNEGTIKNVDSHVLEKHKDYVLRAKDYHSKQERLKAFREKAYFENPDEFYFKMINSKTKVRYKLRKHSFDICRIDLIDLIYIIFL
jgi:hypothetical protein